MKVVSWNVNGIRACVRKGSFLDYLRTHEPDLLFLQEIKAYEEDIPPEIVEPSGYYTAWFPAERKGYSGVALLTKHKPLNVIHGFGDPKFDCEGRVISAEFEQFIALGVYFPNGQMNEERLAYKLAFYDRFFHYVNDLVAMGKNVIVCGDYNTAHKEIDLARPKENETTSGFLPEERAWIDKLIDEYGYVDTFRVFNQEPEQYSWWTYRAASRQRNIGWRIDYCFVNLAFLPHVKDAFIQQDVQGSDHCPVGVELSL